MALRGRARGLRVVAALGVGALVWAWAVAQYPYLLPFRLTISQGAGCLDHDEVAARLVHRRAGHGRYRC